VSRREAFLAGDRPDDVVLFLAEEVTDAGILADHRTAERVEGGVVVVVDGERGRRVFQRATGLEAMAFATGADRAGTVDRDLAGGTCPDAGDGGEHPPAYVLAFLEEQNEAAGGRYAEGDVVHAYARCDCGTTYSERWLSGQ